MLIDIGFLGLQANLSIEQSDISDHIVEARVIDSDIKINFIGSHNFASFYFNFPTMFNRCSITPIGSDYMENFNNQYCPTFAQKIFIVEKMVNEDLSKDDIIELYPELVI